MVEAALESTRISTKGLVKSVFSLEGVLATYLWAGIFKSMFREFMVIDLTSLLGGILILCVGCESVLHRRHLRVPVPFCLAYGLYAGALLLSLTYTTAPIDVAKLKLFRLVIVDGLAVVMTLLFITDIEKLERFMKALILIGLAISLYAMATSLPGQWSLGGVGGSSYIGDGRAIGMALSLCIGMFGFRRLLEQAMVVVLIGGLLVVSARGPIIATLAAFFILTLYEAKKLRKPNVSALIGLLIGAYVLLLLDSRGYFYTMRLRLASLSTRTADASFSDRMYFAKSAAEMFSRRPVFGWGLSSFPFYVGCANAEETPHNLVLELLCEVGIVGLLPFLALLTITLSRLRARMRMPAVMVRGLWCVYVFWILTIPALGLQSARPFLSLLAATSALGAGCPKGEDERVPARQPGCYRDRLCRNRTKKSAGWYCLVGLMMTRRKH